MDSVLGALVDFTHEMSGRSLSHDQQAAVKLRLLDTVACGIGGSIAEPVKAACESLRKLGDSGPCSVFGYGRAAADRATLLNGFMMRSLDCNDSYNGTLNTCHPSDTISAAIAVGEAEHRSGEEVLKAIAAGYEVFCAFSDAGEHRGWDLNFIGAAVAVQAGMLLGLSKEQLANAISLATVSQVALRQTRTGVIAEWKGLAASDAAAHAVLVTYLAAGGMTGPGQPFEGKWGAYKQFAGPLELALDPARNRAAETETKLFPVGNHGLGAVELALELRPRLGNFQTGSAAEVLRVVEQLEIRTYQGALDRMADTPDKWKPVTHETADHSIPFLLALALGYGYLNAEAIDRGMHDPNVLALTAKVRTVGDEEMGRLYQPQVSSGSTATLVEPLKPSKVTVTTANGKHEAALEAPLGNVRRPVTPERIASKYHEYADPVIGPERAAKLEQRLSDFERLPDISGLLDI